MPYADVALDLPGLEPLSYRLTPETMGHALPGCRAQVPVGPRTMVGVITGLRERTHRLCRPITSVLDDQPVMDDHMLWLTRWVSQRYLCSWGQAIWASLPPGMKRRQVKMVTLLEAGARSLDLTDNERIVVDYLRSKGPQPLPYLLAQLGPKVEAALGNLQRCGLVTIETRWRGGREGPLLERYLVRNAVDEAPSLSPARARLWAQLEKGDIPSREVASAASASWLVNQGLARWEMRPVVRLQPMTSYGQEARDVVPTEEQIRALETITANLESGGYGVHLLFGVTASGKTEVYIRAAKRALELGRQALILVPEIGLVSQMVTRISQHFRGLGVWHSELSDGERFDVWDQCRRGDLSLVVGVRSAAFAPLPRLGLVVIDEEHDASYQQREGEPLYHAREVALARAQNLGIPVVLGSATPSAESYHLAQQGVYRLHTLNSRVGGAEAPILKLVDCRSPAGVEGLLSVELADALKEAVSSGEKAMLLLNRRGFARSIQCRRCGFILRCRNCDISLAYHQKENVLCHYCGYRSRLPTACPSCGSPTLTTHGAGIQRLEAELRQLLPDICILRMDSDSTVRKGSHERLLLNFAQGQAKVLIGTQMISKGHHFPEVTLVGILGLDDLMGLPDFRSTERAGQLLVQMSGRAGRGQRPGLVLVQTRMPNSPLLGSLILDGYRRLLDSELEQRRLAGYPPYKKIVLITVSAGQQEQAEAQAEEISRRIKSHHPQLDVLGPAPAPIARLRGRHRYQILLKHSELKALLEAAAGASRGQRRIDIKIEVEPASTL